jgi:hypothetical protein
VDPEPLNIDEVNVSDTIASVTEFAGRLKVPVAVRLAKVPAAAVLAPIGVLFIVPPEIVSASET